MPLSPALCLLPLLAAAPVASQAPLTASDSARHALNRLGYGPTPGQVDAVVREGVLRWVDRQLTYDAVPDPALAERERRYEVLRTPMRDMVAMHTDQIAKALKAQSEPRQTDVSGKRGLRELNGELGAVTVLRAVASERQLAEVLADFWLNHFNVLITKGFDRAYFADYLERTIRGHALGRFEDLLVATATSPAMLFYLDNAQSVADNTSVTAPARRRAAVRPGRRVPAMDPAMVEQLRQRMPRGLNENYARELMELHTLGVDGGYTQADVVHVARILTGWTINRRDGHEFQFLAAAHDRGEKVVLGVRFPAGRGEDEGRALLRMLASHPATKHHVSAKL